METAEKEEEIWKRSCQRVKQEVGNADSNIVLAPAGTGELAIAEVKGRRTFM